MEMVQHFPALNRPVAPVVSVCIANYNGEHILADCLDSVLAQSGEIPVEIIVHDDASSDASIALLRERFPRVELLASEKNVGFCASNNRMVAHARGRYVLLLNNDAALFPDALTALLEAAGEQSAPGILTLPQYDWESGELVDRGCLLDPFYNPVPNLDPRRRDVAYGIGACLFLQRELWNELGGFPEWFESMAEDMYICCLARLRGLPVAVTQASGYRHRQGKSFGGNRVEAGRLNTTYRRRYLSERNKTALMVICTPTALVWPLFAFHMTALAGEGALLSLLKRDRQIWCRIYGPALAFVLRELGALRAERRVAQRMRTLSLCQYLKPFSPGWRKLGLLRRYGIPKVR